jgi:hypothetical protein
MKTFIGEFKKSFSSKGWYHEVINGRVPFRVGYPLMLSLIASLCIAVFFSLFMYQKMLPGLRGVLLEAIPADLVVTVKSGELSINKPVPYALPLRTNERKMDRGNILVIDTGVPANLTSNKDYDTYAFANKTTLVTEKENGEIQVFYFKNMPDFTFDRDTALDIYEKVSSFAWILPVILIAPILIVIFIQMLFVFALAGFLLWIMLKIAGRATTWKWAAITSMYAYTIVFAANIVLLIMGVPMMKFFNSIVITSFIALIFVLTTQKNELVASEDKAV